MKKGAQKRCLQIKVVSQQLPRVQGAQRKWPPSGLSQSFERFGIEKHWGASAGARCKPWKQKSRSSYESYEKRELKSDAYKLRLYLNNCLECRGLEENGLLQDSLNLSRDLGLKNTEAQVLELRHCGHLKEVCGSVKTKGPPAATNFRNRLGEWSRRFSKLSAAEESKCWSSVQALEAESRSSYDKGSSKAMLTNLGCISTTV